MKKKFCRLLSVIVLLSIIAGSIPMKTIAVEDVPLITDTEVHTEATQQLNTETAEETQATIVREDISLRDEFSKHFEMSDGSYTATVYNEPVHQLVDGAWVEIDNSLTLSTSAKEAAQYKTVNGLTDVSFAQSFQNELVTMEQDNHSISWGVQAIFDTSKTVAVSSAQFSADLKQTSQAEILPMDLSAVDAEEQKIFAAKATSTIQYSDALANDVDLEYTVLPSRIKESIILNSPQSISAYTVTINTTDLSARLLDNREVEFYTEDGETVFSMWSPYMYDSASELSEDIEVELTDLGNEQYTITLTPDAAWLNSPDRVYPIVIDPDVSVSRARTNIIDNTVMEGQGNQNRNLDRLYIGQKSGARVRAFLKYDVLPTIPSDATITAATQTLYITSGTDTGSTAGAYIVTDGDWSSDTITWANRPAARTTIHPSISHNNFSYYRFSCLSAVQKWYTGSTTGKNANYGITVRYTDETINDYNAFYSADYSVESSRPLLTISYQLPTETITLNEGRSCLLVPLDVSGTPIWTSSDTSVVVIDSIGITGVKAGKATVTATVDGVVHKRYTVYVTIPDGVYYIKSNSGLYLGTDGGIADGTYARIYSQATSGIAQLRQLWKVTYLSEGYYTIRPLYKLDMVLCAPTVNTAICKNTAPDTFDSIPNNQRWTISYHPTGGGYSLKCNGSGGLALMSADPGTYPGLNATVRGYSASSASFSWTLQQVTSPPSGILIYETATGRVLNNTTHVVNYAPNILYSDLGITTAVYGGNVTSQTVSWVSRSPSVLLVAGTTGNITAPAPGTAILVAQSGGATGSFTLRTETDVTLLALFDEEGETPEAHNDMRTYLEPAATAFRSDGKYVYAGSFDDMQKEQAVQWMTHTPVFFIHTHGEENSIMIGDQQLTSNDLIGKDLSNLDLVVLLSCLTATGGYSAENVANRQPQNFVERMVCSGAETVVGFNDFLVTNDGNVVGAVLPGLLADGYTVSAAMKIIAKDYVSAIEDQYVIGGNGSLRLF